MSGFFDLALARNASGEKTRGSRPDYCKIVTLFCSVDLFAVRLANSKSIPIPGWHDGGLKQWPGETGKSPTAPSPISGPDAKSSGNLLWSIYLHDSHIRHSAAPDNRPMVMPRYGWLGQHRYCCGFSGDQTSEWETLQAEVAMTANSANVAFAHWSHDVSAGVPFLFFEGQASRSGRSVLHRSAAFTATRRPSCTCAGRSSELCLRCTGRTARKAATAITGRRRMPRCSR